MPARFSEVVPDLLYRGGAPTPLEIEVLKEKWGIKQIISLHEKSANNILNACKKHKIKHIIFPIHKYTGKDKKDLIINKIDNLGVTSIINDIPSFVHCKHGKDRTGMFIARYRTENGWDAPKALEEAVTFGFGVGVNDNSVQNYINAINNGPDCENKIALSDVKNVQNIFSSICPSCGLGKKMEEDCYNCTNSKSVLNNLVDISRGDSLHGFQNPGGSTNVSNLWDPQRGFELWNIERNMATASYNKKLRKGIIQAIQKVAQQMATITQEVSDKEKEETKTLIENLDKLINLIDVLINTQINKFINLFKENQGITPEIIKEIEAESYFIYLGKNLKKNIWRIIGNRYIDLVDDIDENQEMKKHVQVKNEKNSDTLFDICLEQLSKFNKDTHIGPMQKSLEESVKNLADLVVKLSDFIEDNLDSKDFQQHFLTFLESIQNQTVIIKKLIKDRIIHNLNKEVLGKDKPHNDESANISTLKAIIREEQ